MDGIDYLVTGASGFLGKHIVHTLSASHNISTLGRSGQSDVICNLAKDVPFLQNTFRTIIHAAGKAHTVPKNQIESEDFFRVNFRGTVHLTQGLEKLKVLPAHFVFISTVAVYGRDKGELIDENHPLLGNSPYARSKVEAEEFLVKWCAANRIVLTILRLPLVVGLNPPGNLGSLISLMKRGLYVGIGSGVARKSMVLAQDVASFIPVIETQGGTFNLTDGLHPSMRQLEKAIVKGMNRNEPFHLPDNFLRFIGRIGDFLGPSFPLNSSKFIKLTSTLTFADQKARFLGWTPQSVEHFFMREK